MVKVVIVQKLFRKRSTGRGFFFCIVPVGIGGIFLRRRQGSVTISQLGLYDLLLGGNVSASAVLLGETITVDFQQCPSVKLVALFTFHLSVKQVVITEENVHVEFGGSRLVKSRDFAVE